MSGSFLGSIVKDVERRLEQRKREVPLTEASKGADPAATARAAGSAPVSLRQALAAPGMSVIAEVKRWSPSRGALRPGLNVQEMAASYQEAGAAAISVLTEEDHFRGSLQDLVRAVEVTRLPVLRKDFIVDEYQLLEARGAGASAVLLILALLDGDRYRELARAARRLNLEVLAEVHGERELEQALTVEEAVIGINNRNLSTFQVDLNTTLRLKKALPEDRLVVSESGVRTRGDVRHLEASGVDGVLVGERLVTSENPGETVRYLRGDGR